MRGMVGMNQAENVFIVEEKSSVYIKEEKKYVYMFIKRCFDIVVALIACIFLLPLTVIVKIATLLTGDTKSIFFRQERIGKDGKPIYIYKFRSMIPNAPEVLKELLKEKKYKEEWDKKQKLDHDPRITKIGKILRKTSLDEFPQFINVLIGDMSMIGPRPLVKGELDMHHGNHEVYEKIRPGITGWWACNGRSATTYQERLDLEYYYIKNQSICLDIKCVIKTITSVLFERGAK